MILLVTLLFLSFLVLLEVVLLPITYPVIRAIKRREPTYGLVA